MKRLDLNTKKPISAIFEFSILRQRNTKFRKIQIFNRNSTLNYSTVKKIHKKELDLNTKQNTFSDFRIFLNDKFGIEGNITKFQKIRIFKSNSCFKLLQRKKSHE